MKSASKEPIEDLCRRYVKAAESGDLAALLALFTENATARSPISSQEPARDFYSHVMQITGNRSMALKAIFTTNSSPPRAAIHMDYTRTIKGGEPATIECVDIFDLNEDCSKFTGVTIIYDTAPVRSDFVSTAGQ